jgi:hypothetical protein
MWVDLCISEWPPDDYNILIETYVGVCTILIQTVPILCISWCLLVHDEKAPCEYHKVHEILLFPVSDIPAKYGIWRIYSDTNLRSFKLRSQNRKW